jgi:hypothetical protein
VVVVNRRARFQLCDDTEINTGGNYEVDGPDLCKSMWAGQSLGAASYVLGSSPEIYL